MAAVCGAQHPDDPTRTCMAKGTHGNHFDRDIQAGPWPNVEVQQHVAIQKRVKGKGRQQVLTGIAADGSKGIQQFLGDSRGGVPAEAEAKWSKEEWQAHAKQVFAQFLQTHPRPFTTAEDIWPLLPAPEEMRAMVLVVRAMRKDGLMAEVGAKRLKGVYRTKDGVEFAENKLVPIYQSNLCRMDH